MKILALDCSTETLSLALSGAAQGVDTQVLTHTEAGGAQASAVILPAILKLMAEAGYAFADLDAFAFGRGPGAFTGLRTACSVAQGLAFRHDTPVLPVDTLLALAEEARFQTQFSQIYAVLDARMGEAYAASYDFASANPPWEITAQLVKVGALQPPTGYLVAGNLAMPDAVKNGSDYLHCLPTASAMLRLAPRLWQAGLAVSAAEAMPLYIRDKVAQTTVERQAARQYV